MSNLNIFNIQQEYLLLVDKLIENGGELTPELETELQTTRDNIEFKGRSYGYVVKQLETDIDTIDAEIKRLSELKKSRSKTVDRLKETLSNALELFEIEKLETPTLKISFRKSESIEIENIKLLDKKFIKTVTSESADKIAIKEAIKNGENVIGAVLSVNKNIQIK